MCTLFENSKKKDDLSDCYLQALTYIMFKNTSVKSTSVNNASVKNTSIKSVNVTKKDFKIYLDNLIKNCSVIDLCNQDFKTIDQIVLPEGITIEHLSKWSMKKYLKFKYQI